LFCLNLVLCEDRDKAFIQQARHTPTGQQRTADLKPPTRTSIYTIRWDFRQRGRAARFRDFWRENAWNKSIPPRQYRRFSGQKRTANRLRAGFAPR
jgi:hypothetical protein